jgi:hypothetical protein
MIDAEAMERGERTLRLIYGLAPGSVPRQMAQLKVSEEAYANVQHHLIDVLRKRYNQAWRAMDPQLEPAIGSMLFHMFLLGLVCGRYEGSPLQ